MLLTRRQFLLTSTVSAAAIMVGFSQPEFDFEWLAMDANGDEIVVARGRTLTSWPINTSGPVRCRVTVRN